MLSEVYDIETFNNLFTYTGYCRQTKEYHQFIIHKSNNQYQDLISHLRRDKLVMIGYNNDNFDYPLIHHLLNHYDEYQYLSAFELCQKIYDKAQSLINNQFNTISDYNKLIFQIDLFKIAHYDNKAKLTSLKALQIAMNLPLVEDMPFEHGYWIKTEEEIQQVLDYNKNDVYSTNEFLNILLGDTDHPLYKGKNKIKLRQDIKSKYGINCINYNDVKLGVELIIKLYSDKFKIPIKDLKNSKGTFRHKIDLKNCLPVWTNFESKELKNVENFFKNNSVTDGVLKNSISFKQLYNNIMIYYGSGGAHACIKPGVYVEDDKYCILDFDIDSLYPMTDITLGIYPEHLGPQFLEIYGNEIVLKRVNEKKKPKNERDFVIVEGFKLAANGATGKYNEPTSPFYDPLCTLRTTVGGQIMISMWTEKFCRNIPDCTILQINTDGVSIRIPREYKQKSIDISDDFIHSINMTYEMNEYSKMVIRDVNNYSSQYLSDGKIKHKGDFEIDKELHKDPSMRIVSIALEKYFFEGIPVKTTIENHTNIYDFCLRLKLNSAFSGEYGYINYISEYDNIDDIDEIKNILLNNGYKEWYSNSWYIDNLQGSQDLLSAWKNFKYTKRIPVKDTIKLGKNTRYYISNSGGAIYKIENDSKKITGVNVGFSTTIFNKYVEKPINDYDINYQFYISECYKIINLIEDKQLSLF